MRFNHFLLISVLGMTGAACGDGFGPRLWDATPDTVLIYSLSRPELLGLPSAYDAIQLRRVLVENPVATGTWDIALGEQNGQFVMLPAAVLTGVTSRAGIATIGGGALEAVREAPADTTRFSTVPVPIQPGTIYVLRTRREQCPGFGNGVRYAKLHALSIDETAGAFRFAIVRNPYCNDRALIPPEE